MFRLCRWLSLPAVGSPQEKSFNQRILYDLKCGVCYVYMRPPIHQCVKGHAICHQCSIKSHTCTLCGSLLSATRNLPLESIAEKVRFPCTFEPSGCKGEYSISDINKHEARCRHRAIRCLIERSCPWSGPRSQLTRHVVTEHPSHVRLGKDSTFVYRRFSEAEGLFVRLIQAYGELFWYYHIKDENCLYWSVFWIGSEGGSDKSRNYSFDFSLVCPNNREISISYTHITADKEAQQKNVEKKKEDLPLKITISMMAHLLSDDCVIISLRIKKVKMENDL